VGQLGKLRPVVNRPIAAFAVARANRRAGLPTCPTSRNSDPRP